VLARLQFVLVSASICSAMAEKLVFSNRLLLMLKNHRYAKISQDKDVVIIEGICEQSQTCYKIIEALGAKVIIVEGYSEEFPGAEATDRYKDFGESLIGVVLNRVPRSRLERVRSEISASFGSADLSTLGVLPEDRALLTVTVGELAEHIQGQILDCAEQSTELVENFMLGAMVIDSGLEYFDRKPNKAAILRAERPDMQLAALETSMRCLVLSGDTTPIDAVSYKAQSKKVPIILTRESVPAIVANIEDTLDKSRFNQEKKLPQIMEILEQHFDFQAAYQGLGLAR